MSTSAISRRYAKALVELAVAKGQVEAVGDGLAQLKAAFDAEPMARLLLESPTLPIEKKSALLNDLVAHLGLIDSLRNFLGLLLEKDRLRYLGEIAQDYRRLADERSGVLRARVVAPAGLEPAQQDGLRKMLEQRTGKTVSLTVEQDAALIGGVQVEFGGRMYDGSLLTQLKRIEDTLVKG